MSSVIPLQLSPGSAEAGKIGRSTGPSRSTSAGSSNGRHTSSKPASPAEQYLYPVHAVGLPEYDYPTPWSIQQAPKQQDTMPVMVKNTFIGTDVGRPSSLDGFFQERQTKSCPASGISLPPGLEDLVEPEEAAARLFAIEVARHRDAEARDTFKSTSTLGFPSHFGGCLDAPLPSEPPQFLPPSPQRQIQFSIPWQQPLLVSLNQAPPLPLLLDSLLSEQSAPHAKPSPYLHSPFSTSCPPPAQQAWSAQHAQELPEPVVGLPECPTVGSKGHFYGTCKPCAFLYTKGCTNGASCPFCHMCDAGEKNRRTKEKRSANYAAMSKRKGASTILHL